MKRFLIFGLLMSLCMVLFIGCSNSENAQTSPDQHCSTLVVLSGGKTKREPVTCAAPLNVMSIYGRSRSQVEQTLGSPRPDISTGNSVYYKDGGIRVIYEDDEAITVVLLPDNLPMSPEAVLSFIGLADMSAKAHVSSILLQWENDPDYPDVTADTDRNGQSGIVYQIYIK